MTSTEVLTLDAVGQADLVRSGRISPTELVSAAIGNIEALNPALNAVITTMFEQALAGAATVPRDAPLAGVPFLVKDLVVEIAGVPMHEGSRFLRDRVSAFDSEIVRRWRRAGLVILGKTNTPEFGMVPTTEPLLAVRPAIRGTSHDRPAGRPADRRPPWRRAWCRWHTATTPAGRSATRPRRAGCSGSNRPGRGTRWARNTGDALGGWAVEHALTRSVRDSAVLLDATAGPDIGDPFPAPVPVRPFAAEVGAAPGRLRIADTARTPEGVVAQPDCVAALDDAVVLLTDLGHELVEADRPGLTPEVGGAIGTACLTLTDWVVRYWIDRIGREPEPDELEPLTRVYRERGRAVSAGQYLQAVEIGQRFSRTVARFLTGFDAWLTPTMSTPPLPIGEITSTDDDPGRAGRAGGPSVADAGVVANVTGNPAMSVPLYWNADGLPIGVHVLGRFGDEATLFRLAGQLESARPWAHRWPPVSVPRGWIRENSVSNRQRPQ